MSSTPIASISRVQITPSNQPSRGNYTFSGGTPSITLVIPATDKLLRTSSLRINGKITVSNANNNDSQGTGASNVQLDPILGVQSVFQTINVASEASGQTLESVRNYGRLCKTLMQNTHGLDDLMSGSVFNAGNGLRASSGNLVNNKVAFSIPLLTGMFMGAQPLPIGPMGGLKITLELASDQQVLSGTAAAAASPTYVLSDVHLSADLLVPATTGPQKMAIAEKGSIPFNSWSSLYSVIQNSDAQVSLNLASAAALSVVHNFSPTAWQNAYSQDSFATDMLRLGVAGTGLASLNKASFSRNGTKLKLDYDLDSQKASVESNPEVGVIINSLNATRPFSQVTKLTPSIKGFMAPNDYTSFGGTALPDRRTVSVKVRDADERAFSIGLALDNVSGVGLSFRGQQYGLRLQSTLDGNSPNAAFSWVLQKNQLMYGPSGITILS